MTGRASSWPSGLPPSVSIIIPTCNRPESLRACLVAVAAQTGANAEYEVIVVDDGGTVDLEPVISSFRDRMEIVFLQQANTGPAGARNAAAARASGDVLLFTDDDCVPDTGWCTAMRSRFAAEPETLVGGRTLNDVPDNIYSVAHQVILDMVYRHYNRDPDNALFFASNNLAVPAGLFAALGGFDATFRVSEDRDLCLRWARAGHRLSYAPEAIVRHAREFDFWTFLWQYVRIGRGAWRFHQSSSTDGIDQLRKSLALHLNPANWRFALGQTDGIMNRAALLMLLILWEMANAVGFITGSMAHTMHKPIGTSMPGRGASIP